jgi:hypothetical protein
MGVAVAAVLVLGGCSSGVTAGDESPSPVGGAQTYSSEKYGYSFEYDAPFEQIEDARTDSEGGGSAVESVAVFDVDGTQVDGQYRDAFLVNVYALSTEITEETLDQARTELEESVLPELEQAGEGMQVGDLAETTVGGLPGFLADAEFEVSGTPMTSQLYFVFDGDTEYQLLTQSASDRWSELEPTFDRMVGSFTVS